MRLAANYLAIFAEQAPMAAKALKEIPTESKWWTGVVVDSILGFSATLVFVLAGVLYIRKRLAQRSHPKYKTNQPGKQIS